MIKSYLKKILKLSPIPLTKNHKYDLLTRKIIRELPSDSNCIDVGCYQGEILDLILMYAPKGQHFGIEPIPDNYNDLSFKYLKNQNCKIFNIAASNKSGVSNFNYVKSNPPYSGLKRRDYDNPNEIDTTIQVKTERLDNVIPDNISIDFIKIDVEGAELLVLEGASNIIKKSKPIIIFEHGLGASNHYGTKPKDIYDYFDKMSMKISNLTNFTSRKDSLSLNSFNKQYYEKLNYYFVAHPA